jgi:hypothetical protein
MVTVAVIVIYILFAVFEVIPLAKQNRRKELVAFTVIMTCAFIISVLLSFNVKIPSFDRFIGDVVTSITKE